MLSIVNIAEVILPAPPVILVASTLIRSDEKISKSGEFFARPSPTSPEPVVSFLIWIFVGTVPPGSPVQPVTTRFCRAWSVLSYVNELLSVLMLKAPAVGGMTQLPGTGLAPPIPAGEPAVIVEQSTKLKVDADAGELANM